VVFQALNVQESGLDEGLCIVEVWDYIGKVRGMQAQGAEEDAERVHESWRY
jgi:hypothetical protein